MTKTFFCSDHHFGHKNILTFKDYDGNLIRDFKDLDHMHEAMIDFHNSVVSDNDRVYFLGDLAINRSSIGLVSKMNGKKILIKGNHDIFKKDDYLDHFEDIRSYKVYPEHGLICSHIPLHSATFGKNGRWIGNVHGHLHVNNVTLPNMYREGDSPSFSIEYDRENPLDPRYLNVSVEQINYIPIEFGEVLEFYAPLIEAKKGEKRGSLW